MLANSAIKAGYEKYLYHLKIPGNKKFVFSPLHKDDVHSRSINHEVPVALFWVTNKKKM
jgi:hypothetical protein